MYQPCGQKCGRGVYMNLLVRRLVLILPAARDHTRRMFLQCVDMNPSLYLWGIIRYG
jgi:hypothetical protein